VTTKRKGTGTKTVKELEREYEKLEDHARELKNSLEEEISRRLDVARAAIDEDLREQREEAAQARIAVSDMKMLVLDPAKVQEAISTDRGPYKIGTMLVEWTRGNRYGFSTINHPIEMTGRKGIMEVWSSDSIRPSNLRWTLPHPGDYVIRILKADGTPGIKFESRSWEMSNEWFPVGKDPNKKKESK
jgi:hypothetical protein